MICSSLKRLLRTTPPLGPKRAIVNGEVTFPLDYFSGAGQSLLGKRLTIERQTVSQKNGQILCKRRTRLRMNAFGITG